MSSRERLVIFVILLISMILLPLSLKAMTEQEVVDEFLAKYEHRRPHSMVAPYISLSYGKVEPKNYHHFVDATNFLVKPVSTSGSTLDGVFRITSFEGGCSIVSSRGMISAGLSYWLTVGSDNSGDFTVYTDLSLSTYELISDFEFRSEIKVWGVYLDYQYFFMNPPIPFTRQTGLSLRAGGGIGYYGAYWNLWDGFGGVRLDTGDFYELEDHLKGSSPGFHLSAGVEYPVWNGFLISTDVKYLWLEFDKLSKKVSPTYELYLVDDETQDPVKIDFSGPRINFTLKKYFTL